MQPRGVMQTMCGGPTQRRSIPRSPILTCLSSDIPASTR